MDERTVDEGFPELSAADLEVGGMMIGVMASPGDRLDVQTGKC